VKIHKEILSWVCLPEDDLAKGAAIQAIVKADSACKHDDKVVAVPPGCLAFAESCTCGYSARWFFETVEERDQYIEATGRNKPKKSEVQLPCFYCSKESLTDKGVLYYRAQLPDGKWGSVEVCLSCLNEQQGNTA